MSKFKFVGGEYKITTRDGREAVIDLTASEAKVFYEICSWLKIFNVKSIEPTKPA